MKDTLIKGNFLLIKSLSVYTLFVSFLFFQILTIISFLFYRSDKIINFATYLLILNISTIFLFILSLVVIIQINRKNLMINTLFIVFMSQILVIYYAAIIHTDFKVLTSFTLITMLLFTAIYTLIPVKVNFINHFAISLNYINFIFVLLQIFKIIPIAQDNERNILGIIDVRPTGILFNAFSMSYGSTILFLISLYFFIKRKSLYMNFFGLVTSFMTLLISGTRTPLILIFIFGILICFQNKPIVKKHYSIITILVPLIILLIPILIIFVGKYFDNQNLATLNGRTLLWECVLSKWRMFIFFGVGAQRAFPAGFCSDDPWFSKLRHPENMFLLNFVESGILGVVTLIILFIYTFWYSGRILKKGNSIAMSITGVFFMSALFYVPLFHYLPFLGNRSANRGLFNFFIFTILWISILKGFNSNNSLKNIIRKL